MSKFKVGDKVRIKSWEQMVKEFGLNQFGSIDCWSTFPKEMKYLCGREFEINQQDDYYSKHLNFLVRKINGWQISEDMIELIKEKDMFTKEDLKAGMVIGYKGGQYRMVMPTEKGIVLISKGGLWIGLEEFSEGLKHKFNEQCDINEVWGLSNHNSRALELNVADRKLLWQREEPTVELTISEIADKLGIKNLKIVKERE